MFRRRHSQFVWLVTLWLCGCAQTVTVRYRQPAELEAPWIQRIAVADISGPNGAEIAITLQERLENESPALVTDRSHPDVLVQTAGSSAGFTMVRQEDADAVITGEVLAYGCADKKEGQSSNLRVRTGEVQLALRLVEVKTGEALAERIVSRTHEWGIASGLRKQPDSEILGQLTEECLDEFIGVLSPREATAEIALAGGDWYGFSGLAVRRGMRLAARGRWEEAEQAWRIALARDPLNDAALYNLAVAAAQRQDYDAAEEFAMEALRLRHTACYAAGLDQVRRFRADAERTDRQRPAALVSASHTAWADAGR